MCARCYAYAYFTRNEILGEGKCVMRPSGSVYVSGQRNPSCENALQWITPLIDPFRGIGEMVTAPLPGEFFEELNTALGDFLGQFSIYDSVVSVSQVKTYVNNRIDCSIISDKALSNIIANHVILQGYNVYFDGDESNKGSP